eukprot:TRINITY_DN8249_c0_g1_i1.p1 TRINITY_DN8249_c0_g1~~TRINITY_DN8249_c0_g1_i1.p1  ORF type:complete len:196 (-),score=30.77 TRINITY_DN8249_c0_g1_i1:306-893(-)
MAQNRNYIFDVPATSALYDSEFTRNPALPSAVHPVRIWITHRENGTFVDKNAELIFVGNAEEKRQIHGKEVDPGWVIILPIEGEYTINVQNQLCEKLGVEIFVDGSELANKHFLALPPYESRSATFHMVKTEEDFELDPDEAATMPKVPKQFGTIRFSVDKVSRVTQQYSCGSQAPREEPTKFGAVKKEVNHLLE